MHDDASVTHTLDRHIDDNNDDDDIGQRPRTACVALLHLVIVVVAVAIVSESCVMAPRDCAFVSAAATAAAAATTTTTTAAATAASTSAYAVRRSGSVVPRSAYPNWSPCAPLRPYCSSGHALARSRTVPPSSFVGVAPCRAAAQPRSCSGNGSRGCREQQRHAAAYRHRLACRRVPLRSLSMSQQQQQQQQMDTVRPESVGDEHTADYRVYFAANGARISPWHHIALYADASRSVLNYVNEIPRGAAAKMELATGEACNPIKQDTKKGKLRYYGYGPSLVNYGALPQTWEDPAETNADTGCGGDNDPLDVIEIGSEVMPVGAVYQVKPLGILALIDDGETDWKVIALNVRDAKAELVNDVADVEQHFPGVLHDVREWFRLYKTAEGKAENKYAFQGEAKDRQYAMRIVEEMHESWRKLRSGERVNDEDLALE